MTTNLSGKGNLATESGSFCGYGFFEDLNQNIRLATQHLVDLSGFYDLRFYFERAEVKSIRSWYRYGHTGEFEQGARIGAEVGIVEKGIFFKSHINKCCIQSGNKFFYFSQIKVTHSKTCIRFFMMQFYKFFILEQGDFNAQGSSIYD